jgi:hypothetical protein
VLSFTLYRRFSHRCASSQTHTVSCCSILFEKCAFIERARVLVLPRLPLPDRLRLAAVLADALRDVCMRYVPIERRPRVAAAAHVFVTEFAVSLAHTLSSDCPESLQCIVGPTGDFGVLPESLPSLLAWLRREAYAHEHVHCVALDPADRLQLCTAQLLEASAPQCTSASAASVVFTPTYRGVTTAHVRRWFKKRSGSIDPHVQAHQLVGDAVEVILERRRSQQKLVRVELFNASDAVAAKMGDWLAAHAPAAHLAQSVLCFPPQLFSRVRVHAHALPELPRMPRWSQTATGALSSPETIVGLHPYADWDHVVLSVLQSAVDDSSVVSVKACIYRAEAESEFVSALATLAASAHVSVQVFIELRAGLDEENNVIIARRLRDAGCAVFTGCAPLKVHAKVMLVERRSGGERSSVVHVGTGNYNAAAARRYVDWSLVSRNCVLIDAAGRFFSWMQSLASMPLHVVPVEKAQEDADMTALAAVMGDTDIEARNEDAERDVTEEAADDTDEEDGDEPSQATTESGSAADAALEEDLGLLSLDENTAMDRRMVIKSLEGDAAQALKACEDVLLVSPLNLHRRLLALIQREQATASGSGCRVCSPSTLQECLDAARIVAVMNAFDDKPLSRALAAAAGAGCVVVLFVRGECILTRRLWEQVDAGRVIVVSVVGRWLEHGRMVRFGAAGERSYWLGSADWVTRKLLGRVEVRITGAEREETRLHMHTPHHTPSHSLTYLTVLVCAGNGASARNTGARVDRGCLARIRSRRRPLDPTPSRTFIASSTRRISSAARPASGRTGLARWPVSVPLLVGNMMSVSCVRACAGLAPPCSRRSLHEYTSRHTLSVRTTGGACATKHKALAPVSVAGPARLTILRSVWIARSSARWRSEPMHRPMSRSIGEPAAEHGWCFQKGATRMGGPDVQEIVVCVAHSNADDLLNAAPAQENVEPSQHPRKVDCLDAQTKEKGHNDIAIELRPQVHAAQGDWEADDGKREQGCRNELRTHNSVSTSSTQYGSPRCAPSSHPTRMSA